MRVKDLRELIAQCEGGDPELESMLADGVALEEHGEDEVYLVTTDPDVARKYDMHDESELMPDDAP